MKTNHSFGGLLSSLEKTQCKFVSKQAQDIMANSKKHCYIQIFFKLVLDLFYKELVIAA